MRNKAFKLGLVLAALTLSATANAESVDDRIRPLGQVNVKGAPAAQTEAGGATAAASGAGSAPAPQAGGESAAPAAKKVAAAPSDGTGGNAGANDGAALYQAKGCPACHGPDGRKTIMPTYPKIAGQTPAYLLTQMKDIKSGARNNAQAAVMKGIIANVTEKEMKAIADWLASQ